MAIVFADLDLVMDKLLNCHVTLEIHYHYWFYTKYNDPFSTRSLAYFLCSMGNNLSQSYCVNKIL